ncbi:MAG: S46 family peptidase [Planctomycetes bacterium]|nr:S46 family peptidase [Planctomycetota bacterium]
MLRLPLPLTFLAAAALLAGGPRPDEGQWLPTQVREMDWAALQKRGMKLTKDEFWHPEKGGVLSATVQINGCTASFVSAEGLMVTNHHCGFSAVTQLSSPEHNYLRDGYAANGREQELPAPGVTASVLKRIEDVTAVLHEAQAKATTDLDRWAITQQTIARLVADGEAREANTKCSVASFLEGKEYHLYYRTQIRDVRLVYVPPRAIGEFGGEVDNWEWPRHTGDFTFFRAYVAPDGNVRDHDESNVPYRPDHFLKVAKDPVQQGDLAIIMGYPGRTQRYETSRSVATQEGYVYPRRDAVLTAAIEVLERAGKQSEAKSLEVADTIKYLANVQKNAAGMIFGLKNNRTAEHKRRDEAAFQKWLAEDQDRNQKWGTVLAEMLAASQEVADTIERDTMMWFVRVLGDQVPLFDVLVQACGAVAGQNGRISPRGLAMIADEELTQDFDLIQAPMLRILLGEFASVSDAQRLAGTEMLRGGGSEDALIDTVLATTTMLDGKARSELFAQGAEAVTKSDDPLIVLARGIAREMAEWQQRTRERQGHSLDVGQRWIAAQEAFRGKSFYPDANSTLRVSIAEIKGYEPRDGLQALPQTTVGGILQKETGKEPFASPKALLEAAKTRDKSRWFVPALGDVPVCFLTNGDTTGGNSGSPVINGRGELIGLNFDRVFENVAGDFGWNAERSRNVVCDFRYVLWVVEAVQPSPVLLRELGV